MLSVDFAPKGAHQKGLGSPFYKYFAPNGAMNSDTVCSSHVHWLLLAKPHLYH